MMINVRREDTKDDSALERIEAKIRMWLYTLMHELTMNQAFSIWFYKILLIIETLQFIWYAFHPNFEFLWDSGVLEGFQDFLKFFQVDYYLNNGSTEVILPFLYITFVVLVIMLVIGIGSIHFLSNPQRKANSTFLNYSLKALNTYNFLLTTVLTFPFYFPALSIFACSDDDSLTKGFKCFEGSFYVHLTVAILGFIIVLITTLLLTLLSIDLNPWSKTPFAAPKSRLNLAKLVMKIAVSIYFAVDYNRNATKVFVALYAVAWFVMLVLRYRQTPNYNRSIFNFVVGLEGIIFWFTLVAVFEAFIDNYPKDNIGQLFVGLGVLPWMYMTIKIMEIRRDNLLKVSPKTLKRNADAELYILNAVELIEKREDLEKRMTLEGLLKLHIKTCNKSEQICPCRIIAGNYYKGEDAPESLWYVWIKEILVSCIEKFPKSTRLHILYAFMANIKLGNRFKAISELIIAQNLKPSTEEQFTIYRLKNTIQQEMVESDYRSSELKIDVNLIVEFQSKFIKFQLAIEKAVEFYVDFWKELLEASPEIQKLQSLGSQINQAVIDVGKHFKNLIELNSNQMKMLQMYGYFLKDIVNDDEGLEVLAKFDYVSKSSKMERLTKEEIKYGENSDTCLITCSGNRHNLGRILRVNSEITRMLNYTKQELTGHNISNIMPKIIGDYHDSFIKKFLETSESEMLNQERLTFPVTKAGYLYPSTIMIKVLPNLNTGVRLIAFLRELDEEAEDEEERKATESTYQRSQKHKDDVFDRFYIMYDEVTGIIHGITKECKIIFGIPLSLTSEHNSGGNNMTIESIIPGILQCPKEALVNPEGVLFKLETGQIKQNYYVAEETTDFTQENVAKRKDTKDSRQATEISVRLVKEYEFGELHLKVIKFKEYEEKDQFDSPDLGQPQEEEESPKKKKKKYFSKRGSNRSYGAEGGPATEGEGEGSQKEAAGSDLSSSQADMNEDLRLIKDFKTFISEKKTPRLVLILRNSIILLSLALIGLMSYKLALRLQQMSEFKESIVTISDVHERTNIIALLNYNLRKLQLVAKGDLNSPPADVADLRAKVVGAVTDLGRTMLKINDYQEKLADRGFPPIESENIDIEAFVTTGIKPDTRYFSDSISQYSSYATSAASAPLSNFISTNPQISTPADFYYVRRNGLGSLRVKSEANNLVYYNFYLDDADSFNTKFIIIMVVSIFVLVAALSVLMTKVFLVHRTSTKVLSLFMYIPLGEIAEMAAICEDYMERYLEDKKKQVNYSFTEEGKTIKSSSTKQGGYMYVEINKEADEVIEVNPEDPQHDLTDPRGHMNRDSISQSEQGTRSLSLTQDMFQSKQMRLLNRRLDAERVDSEMRTLKTEGPEILLTESPIKRKISGLGFVQTKSGEMKKKGKSINVDEEFEANRSEKFLNSKDEYKLRVFLEFLIIVLIFVAYFVVDYTDNKSVLNKIKISLDHLKLSAERIANVRFLQTFTLEELPVAVGNSYDVNYYSYLPYIDWRKRYEDKVLETSQQLSESRKMGFSSSFDSYFTLYDQYSKGNLCANYYSSNAGCANIGNGLLTQGLVITITSIEQTSYSILTQYNASLKDLPAQRNWINSDEFTQAEQLMESIVPVMEVLHVEFGSGFQSFIDTSSSMDKVKFSIFIIVLFLVLIVGWIPYQQVLKEKIFKTKGMLKMIPMELITKEENLKNLFLQGKILEAIK